jgi:hypothetical protein
MMSPLSSGYMAHGSFPVTSRRSTQVHETQHGSLIKASRKNNIVAPFRAVLKSKCHSEGGLATDESTPAEARFFAALRSIQNDNKF